MAFDHSLTHSILINLFIKVGLNLFSPTSPAKYCFASTTRHTFDWFYGGTSNFLSNSMQHGMSKMALFDLENRGIPSWVEKLKVFTLRNTCCDKSTTKSYEQQSLHQNLESYKVYRLWSVDESTEYMF